MPHFLQKIRNTIQYHYYRKKNNWEFPSNMAHTSGARIANGTYEPDLTEYIRKNIHEGATVLDVGANVGYYARLFAQMVKDSGTVVAFEIESENYRCLCENVMGYDQIIPVALAASGKNEILDILKSSHSSCHSTVETGNYLDRSSSKTISMKLDLFWDLYLNKANIDCVKMDVEGAEILVLEGMQEMLARDAVGMMIIEFCPRIMINSGLDPGRLYEQIAQAFNIEVIESEYRDAVGDGAINEKNQFERLRDHLMDSGDFINCNLFCERVR